MKTYPICVICDTKISKGDRVKDRGTNFYFCRDCYDETRDIAAQMRSHTFSDWLRVIAKTKDYVLSVLEKGKQL